MYIDKLHVVGKFKYYSNVIRNFNFNFRKSMLAKIQEKDMKNATKKASKRKATAEEA